MKVRHFFLPHPHTHKKAHLLSVQAFLVYIALFVVLHFGINTLSMVHPGVLGTSTGITIQEIVRLTNEERAKQGLPPLTENGSLNQAAEAKAQNMFAENYWAHYAPSGKTPWDFIVGAGYKYVYAGENLARNFSSAQDVVNAWMASPTHRDNLLNPHYTNIGVAIEDGNLTGKATTLVVQEFGSPVEYIAQTSPKAVAQAVATPRAISTPSSVATTSPQESPVSTQAPVVASAQNNPPVNPTVVLQNRLTNPFEITRDISLAFLAFLASLLLMDIYIIRRRGVVRLASHNLPHFALIAVAASSLLNSTGGSIL